MRLLLIFLALCSGSTLTVLLTKRKAEEAVPFTITAIILVLFLFYIIDSLIYGYYLLLVIFGAIYLFAISLICFIWIKKRDISALKEIAQRIFTPGMVTFLVVYCALYAITRYNLVCDWDSLRLWGAYPKALYFTNRLQLGSESLIYSIMQPYPPGMALFQYFLQRLSSSFKEANLFWAYGIVAISVFLPALRNTNWKNTWRVLVSAFLIFAAPMFFSNSGFDDLNMYRSLYIDPILGLLFAYCLFIGFQDEVKDIYASVRLGVGLAALTLMKDSGLTLAIIAVFIVFFVNWTKLRDPRRKAVLQRICLLSIGIAIIAGCYGLWHWTLRQHGVESFYHFNMKNITFDLSYTKEFLRKFVTNSVLNTPMLGETIGFAPFSVALAETVCILTAVVLVHLYPERERKALRKLLIGLLIGNILFFCGIYFTYLGIYNKTMPCFERYSCTILQANISLIVSLFINTDTDQIAHALKSKNILKLGVAFVVICGIVIFPLNIIPKSMDAAPESRIHANIIRNAIFQSNEIQNDEKKSVYLAFNHDDFDIRHHRIYFELLSDNIFIELYIISVPNQENSVYSANPTQVNIAQMKQSFLNALTTSSCSFVYFVDDTPQAKEQMPEFFSQGTMEGDMYQVVYSDTGTIITFRKIATDIDDLDPYRK